MKVKKKDVIKAVKELNKTLGLEPEIDVTQSLKKLKEDLLMASELIEPGDELSDLTRAVIEALAPMNEQEEEVEEEEVEEEEVEEEEVEEEEVEEEEVEEEEVEEEEVEEEEKPKKEKKKKKITKTRSQALVEALKQTGGKEFTSKDIIQKSAEIYENENDLKEEDTRRGAEAQWNINRGILVDLDLLEKKGNKFVFKPLQAVGK